VLRLWSDQAARAHTILGAQGQEGEEMLSPLSDAARVLSAPRGAAAAAAPGAWGRGGEQAAGVLRDSVLGVLSAGPANGSRAPPDPPGPHASFAETVASALLRLTGGKEAAAAARAMTLPAFARSSSEFNVRAAAALRDLEHLEAVLLGDGRAAPAPGLAALRQDAERRRAELEALASGAALLVYTLARHNPAAIMGIEAYNLDRLEMLAAPARPPPPAPDPDPPADDAALGDEDALGRAVMAARQARPSPLQLQLLAAAHESFERRAGAALVDWRAACGGVAAAGGATGAAHAVAVGRLEDARARWMLSRALAGTVACLVLTPRQFAAVSASYHPRALGMPTIVKAFYRLQEHEQRQQEHEQRQQEKRRQEQGWQEQEQGR
jgi:hypothetical protein